MRVVVAHVHLKGLESANGAALQPGAKIGGICLVDGVQCGSPSFVLLDARHAIEYSTLGAGSAAVANLSLCMSRVPGSGYGGTRRELTPQRIAVEAFLVHPSGGAPLAQGGYNDGGA